jgi:hypothetical protein
MPTQQVDLICLEYARWGEQENSGLLMLLKAVVSIFCAWKRLEIDSLIVLGFFVIPFDSSCS